jgi:CRP-like cAMP-binding protein
MKNKSAAAVLWARVSNPHAASQTQRRKVLKNNPLFAELTEWEFQRLLQVLHERAYEPDEFLFEIDQPGAALFIIEDGEVAVEIVDSHHRATELARLGPGDFLGELALLDQSPRSATARALRRTRTLALFRSDLSSLVQSQPVIASKIYKALATIIGDRLKATNTLVRDTTRAA